MRVFHVGFIVLVCLLGALSTFNIMNNMKPHRKTEPSAKVKANMEVNREVIDSFWEAVNSATGASREDSKKIKERIERRYARVRIALCNVVPQDIRQAADATIAQLTQDTSSTRPKSVGASTKSTKSKSSSSSSRRALRAANMEMERQRMLLETERLSKLRLMETEETLRKQEYEALETVQRAKLAADKAGQEAEERIRQAKVQQEMEIMRQQLQAERRKAQIEKRAAQAVTEDSDSDSGADEFSDDDSLLSSKSWFDCQSKESEPQAMDIAGATSAKLDVRAREFVPREPPIPEQSVTKALVDQLNLSRLPAPEPGVFSGDLLKYPGWKAAFVTLIQSRGIPKSEAMYYLQRYLSGRAQEAVEGYFYVPSEEAFNEAMVLLDERFGDHFRVADAFRDKLEKWPRVADEDGEGLRRFADFLRQCQMAMSSVDGLNILSDQRENQRLLKKLPNFLVSRWARYVQSRKEQIGRYPPFEDFTKFLKKEADLACDPVTSLQAVRKKEPRKKEQQEPREKTRSGGSKAFAAKGQVEPKKRPQGTERPEYKPATPDIKPKSPLKCLVCEQAHRLADCSGFLERPLEERRAFVREKRLCYACLWGGHGARDCKNRATCGTCSKRHPTALHRDIVGDGKEADKDTVVEAKSCACGPADSDVQVALPIVSVRVKGENQDRYIETYALLDPGSNKSFCSRRLIEELGVDGRSARLTLSTLNAGKEIDSSVVTLDVLGSGRHSRSIRVAGVHALEEFPSLAGCVATQEDVNKWSHLKDIRVTGDGSLDVTLLLGQDQPRAIMPLEVRYGQDYEPYAVRTHLGWAVNGPMGSSGQPSTAVSSFVHGSCDADVSLQSQVESFWKLDNIDSVADQQQMSVEDRRVLQLWEDTTRKEDGHYCCHIPFKSQPPGLPNNRFVAEKRLGNLRKRLLGDKELYGKYKDGIQDLLEKGFVEPVNEEESSPGATWYMPHHCVENPNKPKIRIVFDSSAQYKGTSLNKEVFQGPDLLNSLVGVLLRFREQPIAVQGDIEAMFHQVKVPLEDRDVLRFLWFEDTDTQKTVAYRFTVHPFGGVWSPSCAGYALRRAATDHEGSFSKDIVDTVLKNFYLDDCLKSVQDEQTASSLIEGLYNMLRQGGFRLTKWVSSSREVMESVPVEERAKDVKDLDLDQDRLPIQRALGVSWEIERDTLGLKIQPKDQPVTRRGVLSVVSSVYDPLGLVCPFVLRAKLVLQSACRLNFAWDEELDEHHRTEWLKWLDELSQLKYSCARSLVPEGFGNVVQASLHHFADASEVAYGTASYIRLMNTEGQIHCSFLLGKSRLSPLKTVTIPRLELMAAVLAVKVDGTLRRELNMELGESSFWTDSMIVLHYIKSETRRFHTFVANRVINIHGGSAVTQWRHVPGVLNPADDASRGLHGYEMADDSRWALGPDFLWEASEGWTSDIVINPELLDGDVEVKREAQVHAAASTESECTSDLLDKLVRRYSCWYRLRRAVAWLFRFRDWLKDKKMSRKPIQATEIQRAEKVILIYLQRKVFPEEFKALASGNKVSRKSPIYNLDPQLGDGLLKVRSRTGRHPIILPRDHHVTVLVARHAHEVVTRHSGREYVLGVIREQYWIPKSRPLLNRIRRDCMKCKRLRGGLEEQRMANLPVERTTPGKPPFTWVGVDCFGPFLVKRGRSHEKRYGCLFTCCTTRAVHIEVLTTLEADSFINGLSRFSARRGKPEKVFSDNGTNFVGAERELYRLVHQCSQDTKTQDYLARQLIQWEFNPPAASHMGGLWERQIRTVRKVLDSLLDGQVLDDERLSTLFCEVESVINGRPLTAVSDDPEDLEPLTPNHLLLLRAGPGTAPGSGTFTKKDAYGRRWRHVQFLADVFWKRWVKQYLPTLQQRQKWTEERRNITAGDLVLVLDESLPRRTWPLGRIIATNVGPDGLVRSAMVKTKSTVLTRPIAKLCLLEGTE